MKLKDKMKLPRLFYTFFLPLLLAQSPHTIEYEGRTYESVGRVEGKFGWIYEECGPDYRAKVVYKKKDGAIVSKILDDFCIKEIPANSVGREIVSPYPPAGTCYRNELRKKHFEICADDEYYKIDFAKIDSIIFDSTANIRGAYRTHGRAYLNKGVIKGRFNPDTKLFGTVYNSVTEESTSFGIHIGSDLKGKVLKVIFEK